MRLNHDLLKITPRYFYNALTRPLGVLQIKFATGFALNCLTWRQTSPDNQRFKRVTQALDQRAFLYHQCLVVVISINRRPNISSLRQTMAKLPFYFFLHVCFGTFLFFKRVAWNAFVIEVCAYDVLFVEVCKLVLSLVILLFNRDMNHIAS